MTGRRRSPPVGVAIATLVIISSYISTVYAIGALPSGCFTAVGEYLLPNSNPQLWIRQSRICSDAGTSYNFTATLSLSAGSAPTFQAVWKGDAFCTGASQLVLGVDGSTCHFNGSAPVSQHQFCAGTIFSFSGSFPYGVGTASSGDVVISIARFAGGPYSPVFYCEGTCNSSVTCDSGSGGTSVLGISGTPNQIDVTTTEQESTVSLPDEVVFPGSAEATTYIQAPEVHTEVLYDSTGSRAPALPYFIMQGPYGTQTSVSLGPGAGSGASFTFRLGMETTFVASFSAGIGGPFSEPVIIWTAPFACARWIGFVSSAMVADPFDVPLGAVVCGTTSCAIYFTDSAAPSADYAISFMGVCILA